MAQRLDAPKGRHKVVVAAAPANRYLSAVARGLRFVYATSGRPLKRRHDGRSAHVSAAIRCITGRYVTSIPHGFLPSIHCQRRVIGELPVAGERGRDASERPFDSTTPR